jgi:PAS domain-containing protein
VPYLTADQMIRGLVLEFVKTNAPAATIDSDPLHPAAASVLALMPQPLVMINRQLQMVWANRAIFETFAVGPGSLGRPFAEAWGSPSEPAELWIYLEDLVSEKSPRDILIEHPFGRSTAQPVRLTGRMVPAEGDRAALAMVLIVAV